MYLVVVLLPALIYQPIVQYHLYIECNFNLCHRRNDVNINPYPIFSITYNLYTATTFTVCNCIGTFSELFAAIYFSSNL